MGSFSRRFRKPRFAMQGFSSDGWCHCSSCDECIKEARVKLTMLDGSTRYLCLTCAYKHKALPDSLRPARRLQHVH